ncbi:MAG: hypothetical protein JHD31_06215, partial [Rhodoluna sp.]|nr:hypothetical protein [Rhodoluna sp.]
MKNVEVTPGMFSSVGTKPSLKTPITLVAAAAVVLVFFGFLGKAGDISFVWSDKREAIQLPPFIVNSMFFCTFVGVLLLLIGLLSVALSIRGSKTPIWLIAIYS